MTCQGAFKKINFILYTKQTIKSKIKINRCTDVYRDILSQTSSTSYLEPLVAYENQCLMTKLFCM